MSTDPLVSFDNALPNPDFPEIKDITPAELNHALDKVKLVDVRTPPEYIGELGHIANTQLLPLHELDETGLSLPKDETIVFVCRSGRRSAEACRWAKNNGFEHVFNLTGGMILWNENNLEVEK